MGQESRVEPLQHVYSSGKVSSKPSKALLSLFLDISGVKMWWGDGGEEVIDSFSLSSSIGFWGRCCRRRMTERCSSKENKPKPQNAIFPVSVSIPSFESGHLLEPMNRLPNSIQSGLLSSRCSLVSSHNSLVTQKIFLLWSCSKFALRSRLPLHLNLSHTVLQQWIQQVNLGQLDDHLTDFCSPF